MFKGATLFVVGLVLVLFVLGILLYISFSKFSSGKPFKSGFGNLDKMDPLVRFYVKNRYLKDMYATQLNVDSGQTMMAYKEFIDTCGPDTPKHIYEKAIEVYQEMMTMDLYGNTGDTKRLLTMIIYMDAALTDVLNSKFYTADRLDGQGERDKTILSQYTSTNSDNAWIEYVKGVAPNKDEHDIAEQMENSIMTQDYDISRYVESLENSKECTGGGVSSKQACEDAGRRHRLEIRPYHGATGSRVIADDDPLYKDQRDVSKDRNIPMPGIISEKVRDITFTSTWTGRRADQPYNLI
jgi:hypothetical protein